MDKLDLHLVWRFNNDLTQEKQIVARATIIYFPNDDFQAYPTWTDIFSSTDIYGTTHFNSWATPISLPLVGTAEVIFDKVFTFASPVTNGGTAPNFPGSNESSNFIIKQCIDMKQREVVFKESNNGQISDIKKGALILYVSSNWNWSNDPSENALCLTGSTRIFYHEKTK